jgi:hypothetical protein
MNVHHPVFVGRDQHRRDDFHVPGQEHEIYLVLLQHFQHSSIVGLATIGTAGKRFRIQPHGGSTMLSRPFQPAGILLIAEHDRDLSRQRPCLDGIDDRLKIRSPAGNQYADAHQAR